MNTSPRRRRDYGEGHVVSSSFYGTTDDVVASHDTDQSIVDRTATQNEASSSYTTTQQLQQVHQTKQSSSWPVALYIPNLFGYLRILLSFYGFNLALKQQPNKALNLWITAALLDLVDGLAARKLNQCSQFGMVLDVVADNILRSIVWFASIIELLKHNPTKTHQACVWTAIIFLEWVTMFCSQSNRGNKKDNQHIHWKDVHKRSDNLDSHGPPPLWVQAVFKNNFRTLPGVLVVYGLFVAPFGSYVWYSDNFDISRLNALLSIGVIRTLIQIAYVGRCLSALVEAWLCYDFIRDVIAKDKHKDAKED